MSDPVLIIPSSTTEPMRTTASFHYVYYQTGFSNSHCHFTPDTPSILLPASDYRLKSPILYDKYSSEKVRP
jgi:hypothetical protein